MNQNCFLISGSMLEEAHDVESCRHRDRDHVDRCEQEADTSENSDQYAVRDLLEDSYDTEEEQNE